MATKPTVYPSWATASGRIEPTAAQKAAGWATAQHVIAQFLNWIDGITGDWIQWFDQGPAGAWTLPFAWALGSTTTGAFLLAGNTPGNVGPNLAPTGAAGAGVWHATVSLPVRKGQIITTVKIRFSIVTGGMNTASTFKLFQMTGFNQTTTFPVLTSVLNTQTTSTVAGEYVITLTPASPVTMDNDSQLVIDWVLGSVADGVFWGYRID